MSIAAVVPLVFWGNSPPKHVITCVLVTFNQKTLVTGSRSGQIGIWDLCNETVLDDGQNTNTTSSFCDSNTKVVAKSFVFAHNDVVSDLACACDNLENQSTVISAAENGELCLWDADDGLCIQSNTIQGTHTNILPFNVSGVSGEKEWRLVVYGHYQNIFIVEVLTLEILYTLQSNSDSNWLASACVVKPPRRQDDVLVGVTLKGAIKIWPLKKNPENKAIESMFDHQLSNLNNVKALHVVCNSFSQRTIIIVAAKQWQMYDVSNFQFLTAVSAPNGETWAGAAYIQSNCVLVWSKRGSSYMYLLPTKCCPESQNVSAGQIALNLSNENDPKLIHAFKQNNNEMSPLGSKILFSYGRREPFHKLIVEGTARGRINVWKIDKLVENLHDLNSFKSSQPSSPCDSTTSYNDVWNSATTKPCGLLDLLNGQGKSVRITANLFLAAQGKLACGREDGSIIIISAIKAAIAQYLMPDKEKVWPSYQKLLGHRGKVTCLLYPYGEYDRYSPEHLVSGSADFSVKLWNLFTGALLTSFSINGGEILRMSCTPPECNARIQHCICAIARDNSVSLLSLREQRCFLLASCHKFPVQAIRWKTQEDFLIVVLSDGSVYVWQLETGSLDRHVTGEAAVDILTACDEDIRNHRQEGSLTQRTLFTRKLSHIASNMPKMPSQMSLRIVKKPHGTSPRAKRTRPQVDSYKDMCRSVPVRVTSVKTARNEPEFHVMLFDLEALICHLLMEEVKQQKLGSGSFAKKPSNDGASKHVQFGVSGTACQNRAFLNEIHDAAQLLVSCLHSWGLDLDLDLACRNNLGLLKPTQEVCFGLLTHGKLSLLLPGWHNNWHTSSEPRTKDVPSHTFRTQSSGPETLDGEAVNVHATYKRSHRWQICSSLTTQHSLSVVALANTLMGMSQISFVPQDNAQHGDTAVMQEELTTKEDGEGERQGEIIASLVRASIKAGWSRLATLYCCQLPDKVPPSAYKPALLHVLARKWQDRCLEIREAAQAILVTELRRIGHEGRVKVVESWVKYLPVEIDESVLDNGGSETDSLDSTDSSFTDDDITDKVIGVLDSARKLHQYDNIRRQSTSIVMLAVIGSEFQKDLPAILPGKGIASNRSTAEEVATLLSPRVVHLTSKALMCLLLKTQTHGLARSVNHTAMRRAAVDLIGRGFPLWEAYLDVSSVLMTLLDLCSDSKQREPSFSKGLPLTPVADSQRSARHALTIIATARPLVFITTLAKEVARSSNHSSTSFTHPSPTPMVTYSYARHQVSATDAQNATILNKAKKEILRVVDLVIEKKFHEVLQLLPEVTNIVVFCISSAHIKEKSLQDIFPGFCKFNMISYCPQTKRLAVGAKNGQLVIYELRPTKQQTIAAHSSPITAVQFSKDGKFIATYAYDDEKINFWQTSSSLFGVLGSGLKCVKSNSVKKTKLSQGILKQVKLVWVSQKACVLLLPDGSQIKHTV